jgi:hypothetical protein
MRKRMLMMLAMRSGVFFVPLDFFPPSCQVRPDGIVAWRHCGSAAALRGRWPTAVLRASVFHVS